MQSAGRGSTSPGLELPSVRLADPDRAVLRAGLVGPDRVRLPLAVGAGAAIYVDGSPCGRGPGYGQTWACPKPQLGQPRSRMPLRLLGRFVGVVASFA